MTDVEAAAAAYRREQEKVRLIVALAANSPRVWLALGLGLTGTVLGLIALMRRR